MLFRSISSEDFHGAPCTDPVYDPNLWEYTARPKEPDDERQIRHGEALALCHECPFTAQCLHLRQQVEGFGVWGARVFKEPNSSGDTQPSEISAKKQRKCPNGHDYTEGNTQITRNDDGSIKKRQCRTCMQAREARRRARLHEAA